MAMASPAKGSGGHDLFIPIAGASPPPPQHRAGRLSSSGSRFLSSSGGGGNGNGPSGQSGGGGGRRRGSGSFGGRGNDGAALLKEVKEVLNRIRWDLAEVTGVDFAEVKVHLQDDAAGANWDGAGGTGAGADGSERLCRQWVREARCDKGHHCKYSHAVTLAPLGARPSTKSAGSMAPLRVLEGYGVEAAMGAAASYGASAGSGSGAGGIGASSSSLYSSSPGMAPLYRAVFIEYGGKIVWDKERPDVWEDYLASFNSNSSTTNANGGGSVPSSTPLGLPPTHPATAAALLLRRNSSADSLIHLAVAGGTGGGGEAAGLGRGNRLLGDLPQDVGLELFGYLGPGDCARCLQTCRGWAERAGDGALWARFLAQCFGLAATYQPPSPSRLVIVSTPSKPSTGVGAAAGGAEGLSSAHSSICDLSRLALEDLAADLPTTGSRAPTPPLPPLSRVSTASAASSSGSSPARPAAADAQHHQQQLHMLVHDILRDPPTHPRREYGRLAHVCRNAQALSNWSGAAASAGTGTGRGGHAPSASAASIGGLSTSTASSSAQQQQQPPPERASTPGAGSVDEATATGGGGSSTVHHVVQRFHGHDRGAVIALHVDEAKDRLISADVAGSVRLWELHSGARLGTVDLRTHLTCLTADARTIYVGTLKGALHTVDRDDLADVQVHRLGQVSNISSICLLRDPEVAPRPPSRQRQHHRHQGSYYAASPASAIVSPLGSSLSSSLATGGLRTPSPHHLRSGAGGRAAAAAPGAGAGAGMGASSSGIIYPRRRTPTPDGRAGAGDEEEVRPRMVVGFGNGSFLLLHGTERMLLLQPPAHASGLSAPFGSGGGSAGKAGGHPFFNAGGGSLPLASSSVGASGGGGGGGSGLFASPSAPVVQHHLYSLPVAHPACVFLAATGPRSFVAAACPDRLFCWASAVDGGGLVDVDEEDEDGMAAARRLLSKRQQEPQHQPALPALSLTCAFSHAPPLLASAEGAEEEEAGAGAGAFGFPVRHSVAECCDVAVIAIAPEAPVEEEPKDEEEEEGSSASEEESDLDDDDDDDDDPLFPTGGGARRRSSRERKPSQRRQEQRGPRRPASPPTLVVTACNHDAALRWWELTPGKDAAVCVAVTPAFAEESPATVTKRAAPDVGTLSLAQAGGVLLSAHLDRSLVVWHVGQRQPVAHYRSLPLLESIKLTPRGLGLLACFERHVIHAHEVTAYGPGSGAGGWEDPTALGFADYEHDDDGALGPAAAAAAAEAASTGSGRRRGSGGGGGRRSRRHSGAS